MKQSTNIGQQIIVPFISMSNNTVLEFIFPTMLTVVKLTCIAEQLTSNLYSNRRILLPVTFIIVVDMSLDYSVSVVATGV